MLAFELRYLLGRVTAADYTRGSDKDALEWPPHPARLFSALVQAWADLGKPADGRRLLERLQAASPPEVWACSLLAPDGPRVAFVPVNDNEKPYFRDTQTKKEKAFPTMGGFRIGRDRKERRFVSAPVVWELDRPHAVIGWPDDHLDDGDRGAAIRLASQVGYLGHSASVIAVEVGTTVPDDRWVSDDVRGSLLLRVPGENRLAALESAHRSGRRPPVADWVAYAVPETPSEVAAGPWRDLVVFRLSDGPHHLPIVASLKAARQLRDAVSQSWRECHGDEPPMAISGVGTTGGEPRLSYAGLPNVGHDHADGHLLGVACLIPTMDAGVRRQTLRALGRLNSLDIPGVGGWSLTRQTVETPVVGLLPRTWAGPATQWASVTPIAFERDPGELLSEAAEREVGAACTRLGLDVLAVEVSMVPFVCGAEHAREHPYYRSSPTAPRRRHVHAVISFRNPVQGPLVVGAGRFVGYGLLRPVGGFT